MRNSVISQECIDAYNAMFSNSGCGYVEPGPVLWIIDYESDDVYYPPDNETDISFMDRLERCRKTGENLFFREWTRDKYRRDVVY